MRPGRGIIADRGGATALEFAILAPVLIMMLIGIFNVGYAMYCGSAVRNAVQRSARVLVATPSTTAATLTQSAEAMLVDVPVNNLTLTITTEQVTAAEQIKRVSWTYNYDLWIPLINAQSLSFNSSMVVPMPPTN